MIKRNQGTVVAARSYHARNREMRLAVLTHNIGILWLINLFDRACRLPNAQSGKPSQKKFKQYPIGYVHIDIAEVRTEEE